MKKLGLILFCIAFIFALGFVGSMDYADETHYALSTTVVEVDHFNDIVTVEDFNGNIWEFEGVEDWEVGDIASCLMDSKGTETIFDDEIVKVKYDGWR